MSHAPAPSSSLTFPAPAAVSIRSILLPLVAIVLGTFMAILDHTAVNVALPTLGQVFGVDLRVLQWVITGYSLAQAAVIPLAGWLSDRFGAKRVYLTAIVLFVLGSLLCAIAPSAQALILFRVLQGLGGGMLMPIGMAFLFRLAPPHQRGAVMAAFGIPILLAPASGPILAGWLVEFADWRSIFTINVPVGMLAVALGIRALPSLQAQGKVGALDLPGAVLGPLAFASLIFGIGESFGAGWTGVTTLGGLSVGAAALALFVWRELSTPEPLLELRVFANAAYARAVLTHWLMTVGMFGSSFLVPLFLQQARGYGAFETGLTTLPQPLMAALMMPIGGRVFDRFGVRGPVPIGLTLLPIALFLVSRVNEATTPTDLVLPLGLWGAGMGLAMMSISTHQLNIAPRNLVSRVTSLANALQSVIIALAVAGSATLLQARTAARVAEHGPVPAAVAGAFGDVFLVGSGLLVVALMLSTTLRRAQVGAPAPAGSAAPGVREPEPAVAV